MLDKWEAASKWADDNTGGIIVGSHIVCVAAAGVSFGLQNVPWAITFTAWAVYSFYLNKANA